MMFGKYDLLNTNLAAKIREEMVANPHLCLAETSTARIARLRSRRDSSLRLQALLRPHPWSVISTTALPFEIEERLHRVAA